MVAKPILERFWSMVSPEPNSGCWLWTGRLSERGYASIANGFGKLLKAHRFAYETFRGPIPAGLHIDHKCRVRSCVNPDHLEPVTAAENIRRGHISRGRHLMCRAGHAYAETGAKFYGSAKVKACPICKRVYALRAIRKLRKQSIPDLPKAMTT